MKKFAILMALALVASLLVFNGGQTAKAFHAIGGAVAYWPFDDGSDPTAELAHGNVGSLEGDAAFQGGADIAPVPDNVDALEVGGSGHVDAGSASSLDITGSITLAAWINPDLLTTYQEFISKGDYADTGAGSARFTYFILVMPSTGTVPAGTIRFGINIGGPGDFVDSSSTVSVDTWTHIAATFDPATDTVGIFIDGTLDSSGTITNNPPSRASDELFIGALKFGSGILNGFDGSIDEVQIYDRVLSVNDIEILAGQSALLFVDNDDGQVGLVTSIDCNGVGVRAYSIIQDAVDAASAGDTINVCPGEYNEDVDINTDDLTLTGNPGDATAGPGDPHAILDGTGLGDTSGFYIGFGVSDITIEGFEIRDYTNPGRYDSVCSLATGGFDEMFRPELLQDVAPLNLPEAVLLLPFFNGLSGDQVNDAFNNDEDVQSALKPFPNKTWKLKLSLVPIPLEEEKRLVVA